MRRRGYLGRPTVTTQLPNRRQTGGRWIGIVKGSGCDPPRGRAGRMRRGPGTTEQYPGLIANHLMAKDFLSTDPDDYRARAEVFRMRADNAQSDAEGVRRSASD